MSRFLGPRVLTELVLELDAFTSRVEEKDPEPDSFTYQNRNEVPNPGFHGSEPPGSRRIGYPFISVRILFPFRLI